MPDSFDTDAGGNCSTGLIGQAPRFMAAVRLIGKFAGHDAPVLIEGETGTGKDLAARALHFGSRRCAKRFVPVNCGAIPESLIENELFGHVRGAFTGAGSAGPGLLSLANQGTLFLDEIDALPARGQVALLRFLQDGSYRPLGAQQEEVADIRIIVASNRKLEALVDERSFRADLLFRLRVLSLDMPALRERPGDPFLLADHFLKKLVRRYGASMDERTAGLDPDAHAWFNSYFWPGNVRELENLIHRAFLMSDGPGLHVPTPHASMAVCCANMSWPEATGEVPHTYALARMQALESFHREYLGKLLRRTQGNVSEAARVAGKERRALGKLLKQYRIDYAQFRN